MKTALFALTALACISGCRSHRTQLQVLVEASDPAILDDVHAIRVVVNPSGGDILYDSGKVSVCHTAAGACHGLPLTVTLLPGAKSSTDAVHVLVEAYGDAALPLITEATQFRFADGATQYLHFELAKACLGTHCADADLTCDVDGQCVPLGPPDGPWADGGSTDLSAATDQSVPTDLAGPDLFTPTQITRLSGINDSVAPSMGFVTIPPPTTAAVGDLVLLFLNRPQESVSVLIPSNGWTPLGSQQISQDLHEVGYRIVTTDESTHLGRYTFASMQTSTTPEAANYVRIVYRGAATAQQLVSTQGTGLPLKPTLPPVPAAAAGSVVLDAVANFNNGPCTLAVDVTAAPYVYISNDKWNVLEILPASDAKMPITFSCNDTSASWYQVEVDR